MAAAAVAPGRAAAHRLRPGGARRAGPALATRLAMRKVLVVGASGRTGRQVVERARAAGLEVAPAPDVLDPAALAAALAGCEAVISTLGPVAGSPPDLCARGTANLVAAM